jgi:hypothetical protein
MKVKTTFTIEVICNLDQCVAHSVVMSGEDADHEAKSMEDTVKESLYNVWDARPILVTCIDVQREPLLDW